ncbi:EAL domain-containing protein [Liquorilactobacillus satsumensis]|uniref:EAL domain-containing protein n=1 Tax=Liquorilactobacillus satsumensis TaxID=259059 RepID=UPI0021C2949C|nr:EAL domain-containing protein [Liquorilactobacillus satsumensis]MCP9313139.1 EAL domain-containing protein [Liquorilactobacillus satsumensis]MCP9359323.1 EAL domain-containing protein [Liquorilactobacillus satsumensis]
MYRFYVQPQKNMFTNSLIGYEMLIRKYNNNKWQLPQDFTSVPIVKQIELLKQIGTVLLLKVDSISFNLNQNQFVDETMAQALIETQKHIYPLTLVVELTEDAGVPRINLDTVKKYAQRFLEFGIELSIDDVSTGENVYQRIEPLLPCAAEIKFPLQNLRKENRLAEIPGQLLFWRKVARTYHLRLIVEGIESTADDELLNELSLPLRQGFFYEKPHLLRLPGDPKL